MNPISIDTTRTVDPTTHKDVAPLVYNIKQLNKEGQQQVIQIEQPDVGPFITALMRFTKKHRDANK